jgi:hypothetical protein
MMFSKGWLGVFDLQSMNLGFIRKDQHRVVVYLGQIADAWHTFDSPEMNLSMVARAAGAQVRLRLTNLLNSRSTTVQERNGGFQVSMSQFGIDDDTKFCLLEASPA